MKIKIDEIEKIPSYNQKSSNDSKWPLEILMEKKDNNKPDEKE